MATYSNIGIKLITTGDESGTWGTSTNTNFSDVLDEAIAGAVTYNISSDADFTLTVSDGTSSDARHAVIKFTSTTLTATRVCTFAPNDLQKTWVVINSTTGGQSLTFKQGSAGGTVTVPNGESAIIYSDGGGSSAGAVTRVLDSFTNTKITTGTLNATTLDLTNLEVTNIKAKDGTAALTIADSTGKVTVSTELAVDNLNLSGNAITSTDTNGNIDLTPNGTGEVNITKVDIDSGAIDGTPIGASSASTGAFTTLSASSTVSGTGFSTYLASPPAIGSTAANTGAFTTLTTSSTVTLNGGTANGVLYLNGSKVATSGSGFTYDGTSAQFGDVLSSADSSRLYIFANTPSTTSYAIKIGGNAFAYSQQAIRFYDTYNGAYAGFIGFTTNSLTFGQGTTESMRLTSTGLGIGTSSPGFKLDVNGASAIRAGNAIRYYRTDNAIYTQLYDAGSNGFTLDNANGDGFRFQSNGTNQLVLNSSGNLGIGTTSPADTNNFGRALDIRSSAGAAAYFRDSDDATKYAVAGFFGSDSNAYYGSWGTSTGVLFYSSGSERARITAAGELLVGTATATANGGVLQISNGITFPATQSASTNANTLDDYEEGTWTGTLKGGTTDPTTPVTATGKYTKIGRQVTVAIYFENVNTTGAAGSVYVTGLPFTEDGTRAVGVAATYLFDFPAGVTSLFIDFSGTRADFVLSGDNVAWDPLLHSAGAGRYARATGTYFV